MTGSAKYVKDLVERVLATYAETFLGLMLASGLGARYLTDVSVWNKALIACAPALFAIIKGGLAKFTGAANSASLLSAKNDPPGNVAGNAPDMGAL